MSTALVLPILALFLVAFIVDLVGDLLNLSWAGKPLPQELQGVYDEDRLSRSREYLSVRTLVGIGQKSVQFAGLLLLWFTGGFNTLDHWVRGLGWHPLPTGVLYLGILGMASSLVSLLFDLYTTFVVEERFGFNRTTPRTFLLDRLKGALLVLLLGAPLLTGVLWFFRSFPHTGWLYAWGALFAFSLVVQFFAPRLIMPLFYRFLPLEHGALREAIEALAARAAFPLGGIFLIDGSRRSRKANAFFTGFGTYRRIALYDTLVEEHPLPEITAVLAHEIGHWRHHHLPKGLAVAFLEQGVHLFLLSWLLTTPELFVAFGMDHTSVYVGLLLFSTLLGPLSTLLSVGRNGLSRAHEYEADRFAVATLLEPRALQSALKRLSTSNLSNPTPHPFYVLLHYSHPPLAARLKALQRATEVKIEAGV